MEPHNKHRTRKASGTLKKRKRNSARSRLYLPNIAALIEAGQITVGVISNAWCIGATADDGHNTLAMLVRGERETLVELLTRLDKAIAKAQNEGIVTDEINTP